MNSSCNNRDIRIYCTRLSYTSATHRTYIFWNKNYKDQETLTIDKITYDYGSPGKVFKIDELSIANRLSELENLTKGYYRWTDTTGLNQISRNKEVNFNSIKFLEKSFKQIKKQQVA